MRYDPLCCSYTSPQWKISNSCRSFYVSYSLIFGICYLVILDYGNLFKSAFSAMCKALNINFDILAKRNHNILLVEKYYKIINKDDFVATGVAVGYALNSSPIDRTDILRSVHTISWELPFPLIFIWALNRHLLIIILNLSYFTSVSPILIVCLPLKFWKFFLRIVELLTQNGSTIIGTNCYQRWQD